MKDVDLTEYDYELPDERIAQYPADVRDSSKLLISGRDSISEDIFRNIGDYLPSGSLLIFNNTRVIRARIIFRKETGASVEILCLEPLSPIEYELSFSSREPVEWKCLVGNLKKWKSGMISTSFYFSGKTYELRAEKISSEREAWRVRFTWNNSDLSFGEVIEAIGHIPLPPYIIREDNAEDVTRYQTVYSRVKGSVAAPTAGLHFTENVLTELLAEGIIKAEITLHVGAGTFQPVKSRHISGHEMHFEHFFIAAATIKQILENNGKIIPVGTTSVRTLESLYWLGVKLIMDPAFSRGEIILKQWEIYDIETNASVKQSMEAILNLLKERKLSVLHASTGIIIVPGYKFRMISGMITNFHQPRSTLLLLVSAWAGKRWKEIYDYALGHEFRFLSYGDCSLLLKY